MDVVIDGDLVQEIEVNESLMSLLTWLLVVLAFFLLGRKFPSENARQDASEDGIRLMILQEYVLDPGMFSGTGELPKYRIWRCLEIIGKNSGPLDLFSRQALIESGHDRFIVNAPDLEIDVGSAVTLQMADQKVWSGTIAQYVVAVLAQP